MEPTADSMRLRTVAADLVERLTRETSIAGALLAGSAAEGIADAASDIDLMVYVDDATDDAGFERFWAALAASHQIVERGHPGFFQMDGVEVQLAPQNVHEIAAIVDELVAGQADAVGNVVHQKVAMGLVHGSVLCDGGVLEGWRSRLAAFPVALQRAMAEHHLSAIFPYWRITESMSSRDARLFEARSLIDGAFHVLGALAAAHCEYYSDFQLKRMRRLIARMTDVPAQLADRLEGLVVDTNGPAMLREVVAETIAIVERRIDGVDVARARHTLR